MRQQILALIKQIAGQKNILTVPRLFITITGDIESALFLSQLIFWQDIEKSSWVPKTYAQIEQELCLTEYKVRKIASQLKAITVGGQSLLETCVKKCDGNPTVHYHANENVLEHVISSVSEVFQETNLEKPQERTLKNHRNEPLKTTGTYLYKEKTIKNKEQDTLNLIAETFVSAPSGGDGQQANGTASMLAQLPSRPSPKKQSKVEVPAEYDRAIRDAWTDVHRLPDGTNPLTPTDYKILRKSIETLHKDGIPLDDVLKAIKDFSGLRRAGVEWALNATPGILPKLISRSRAGALAALAEGQKSNAEKNLEMLMQFLPKKRDRCDSARGSSHIVQHLDSGLPQLKAGGGDGSDVG